MLARIVRENVFDLVAGILCLVFALVAAGSLWHVPAVLRRNPVGWRDTADLAAAAMFVVATWGFFRFIADLVRPNGLWHAHPGHLAWWLSGGVWVMAGAVELVVEGSSYESNAVGSMTRLGSLLGVPFLPPLLMACLRRADRTRAGWRGWAGFGVAATYPAQYLLFMWLRD